MGQLTPGVSMHDESCELCGSAREAKLREAGHRIEMLTNIRRDGYHKMGVFSETEGEPEFSYTVGLFHTYEHPEVIIFGLEINAEFAVLHTVQELVANGMMFSHGDESFEVLDGTSVVFVDFSRVKYDEYLGQAENFYQSDDFPVLMLVWPDRDGVFPWSDGAADWLKRRQPALWSSVPPA
jgi:hypothetical protein